MEKRVFVNHAKGQRHPGKTEWNKVLRADDKQGVESENPVLALNSNKHFYKPAVKKR